MRIRTVRTSWLLNFHSKNTVPSLVLEIQLITWNNKVNEQQRQDENFRITATFLTLNWTPESSESVLSERTGRNDEKLSEKWGSTAVEQISSRFFFFFFSFFSLLQLDVFQISSRNGLHRAREEKGREHACKDKRMVKNACASQLKVSSRVESTTAWARTFTKWVRAFSVSLTSVFYRTRQEL